VRADPELSDVHIVLLTARGQETDRATGIDAGANDYLTKPFSPSKILEKAKSVVGA
jgi:DNA-binding response OmpR family regulator